ncbi:MAG: penicillin acylase family protein [Pseudomonadota bacterium]
MRRIRTSVARTIDLFTITIGTTLLVACSPGDQAAGANGSTHTYDTTIQWTSYGIPHVNADDWGSLGFGYAYATAKDGICVIAKDLITVRGEKSQFFPDEADALVSDVFHKAIITADKVAAAIAVQSEDTVAFNRGYADGYNRYLKDNSDADVTCRGAAWLRPIDEDDVTRMQTGVGIRYGLARFAKEISGAVPPGELEKAAAYHTTDFDMPRGIGSNAIALGKDATHNGRGILFGNPHYPWHGPSRFHMIHTTIPGELDVMGVSLLNTNRVAIGFNKDIAWTHTVSTATRFTLYRLAINPENPMQYLFDGVYQDITPVEVEVDLGGSTHKQNIYLTHLGPMVTSEQLPWNRQVAFALRDAVIDNYQTAKTYSMINKATSIAELEEALHQQGVYWTNTIAADKDGNAYYADISGTPNLNAAQLEDCQIPNPALPRGIIMLDGTRSRCEWEEDERSKVPGALPAEEMPRITTASYVTNSNDSYWLSNPDQPLEGYSPIIGSERTARSLRTRAGLVYLDEIDQTETKYTSQIIQDLLYSHRNYGAELLLEEILAAICGSQKTNQDACAALEKWDRTMTVDSKGGHLWREFWEEARNIEDLYATPFDVEDPVNTPRGITTTDTVKQALATALNNAADKITEAGLALDARLGDIQYAARNGNNIPVPGGEGWAGMFSMIVSDLNGEKGYAPIIHGNSYIQVVSWDDEGKVVPTGILTYSQSPEPSSPHYADQTELYAQGEWLDLPFYPDQITADPNLVTLRLTE